MKLFLDFESFYSSKEDYTLKSLSMTEYVRSPKFKAFGAGMAMDDGPLVWIPADEISDRLDIFWDQVDLIGHNVKFDAAILNWVYGYVPRSYIDTKGMSRAVLGKTIRNHSLATLAEHFGLEAKGYLKTDNLTNLSAEQEKELAEYCLHDVALCREVYSRLANKFPQSEYAAMNQTVRMFVEPKLNLNVPLLEKTAVEEAKRRETIFQEIGIEKSVFASNKKFPALLMAEGYEVPTKVSPRTGKVIPALALGDTEFLELKETDNERLRLLCEARIAAKSTLLETRSTKLAAIGATGRWPFDVEYSGADQTHRFSGGSGAGGNPQNFTRNSALRSAVEAPQNFELVVGDFSNIELRLVAYLSKDPGLIGAIENGKDIYCDFASAFFGRTITKADEKERRFGKTAILGLGYGMGWEKFIRTVRVQTGDTIDEDTSRKAVDLYRTRYGRVPELWETLSRVIPTLADKERADKVRWRFPVQMGYQRLVLPSGLSIRFPNLRQEPGRRNNFEWVYDVYVKGHIEKRKLYGGKVLENISQALAGELCKTAMLEIGENVTGLVHDEIHVLCKKGLGQITAQKLKRAMTTPPAWMPEMILDAEVHAGPNWGIK